MRRNYRDGDHATLALEKAYYDKVEGHYEPLAEIDYDAILANMPATQNPVAILEVGCGSGAFGTRLQRRLGARVNVGLDVSLNLLRKHPFMPVLGDGQALPFVDNSFDLIAASASLHHIHSLTATLTDIFRCLKRSGRVIFVEPNADHPYRRIVVDGGFLRDHFLKTTDESIFPTDLVAMMNHIGFKQTTFRYATFRNQSPMWLGRIQWWVARLPLPRALDRYVHSWFVLESEK